MAKIAQVPLEQLRSELLAIKGVGGETADSILVYALGRASFVIDAYTRRIVFRFGVDVPVSYEDFHSLMENCISPDLTSYDYYHGLIVEHAKAYCTKKPKCEECPLETICEKRKDL